MAGEVLYDNLRGPGLADRRWQVLEFPLEDGTIWRHEEPSAKTADAEGALGLRVERYERSHDTVQIFDNPKHLVVSVEEFAVPRSGESVFSVQMAAETIGSDPIDYRDGFIAFNVLDLSTAAVFDHIATSKRALAVHERLFVPGVVDPGDAFSWFVEAPFSLVPFDPSEFHEYSIAFSPADRRVRWFIDDRLTFEARDVEVPNSLRVGFGLFTLHPIAEGRSVSLRGQGMAGRWRDFRVPG